jgi:xanthine dehydrogenase accessory factor
MSRDNLVLVRGGGDLATGVALRLHRAGIGVVVTELPQPLAVRRTVAFAEAVYEGAWEVEGVRGRLVGADQLSAALEAGEIPVLIDPDLDILTAIPFLVVVDGRLTKRPAEPLPRPVPLHIGLGPGFTAESDCHAVIETRRSHTLGRVIWHGPTQPDSGEPEGDPRRVLRASGDGILTAHAKIGERVKEGQLIAEIQSEIGNRKSKVESPFAGVLRGIVHDGLMVRQGMKVGDVDPRNDPSYCYLASDKALAIGGGALEAVLSKREIREKLFGGR